MKLTRKTSTTLALVLGSVAISVNDPAVAQEVTWTPKTSMPTARYGLAAGVVNNIFYAVGGFNNEIGRPMETTVEAYDPVANAWTTKAPIPTGRVLAAAGVVNDTLYVLGGTDFGGTMFATVEAYNPGNNSWVRRAPMPAPRYGQAVAGVNGILYAVGGWDGGRLGRVSDLWAYNPTTDVWSLKSPMRTARMSLAIAEVNGTLYAIGGELNGNSVVGTVEAYNPATDTWTTRASMPTPRLGLAAATVNGIIYAVGGATEAGFQSTHSFLSTVEAYDPATDAWTTTTPMPTPRSFLGTGVINDTLYAAGGTIRNTGLATMEAFTTTLPTIAIDIEIKPGSINPRSQGKVLAVVLTTDTFDATTVDPSTVRLGATAAPPVRAALQDFDGDGRIDLILHFNTRDTGLECGETSLSLTGMTFSGQAIEGSDSIRTLGCQHGHRLVNRAYGSR